MGEQVRNANTARRHATGGGSRSSRDERVFLATRSLVGWTGSWCCKLFSLHLDQHCSSPLGSEQSRCFCVAPCSSSDLIEHGARDASSSHAPCQLQMQLAS